MKNVMLFFIILTTSCGRLDDIAYVNDNSIESYGFNNYDGESELELPNRFKINDSLINLFSVSSKGPDDDKATEIYFVYIGNLNTINTDTVIVYCHGQSLHMDYYWSRASLLANTGGKNRYGVLMMDYRGYGLSEGTPSEKGMEADVDACINWLKNKGVNSNRLMLYGFSLGTIPAIQTAATGATIVASKLIVESPLASADNVTQESTIINLSAKYIIDSKFNNAETIKQVNQPLMWLHGTEDDYLNISNGEIIYKNHGGDYKEAHRIDGANHGSNGVPETMGFDNYLNTIYKFITRKTLG